MPISDIIKTVENFFHSVVSDLSPALDLLEAKGGSALLALGESVLAGFVAGESWPVIIAAFIPQAEASGVSLAENEASIILNIAKANLLAKTAAAPVLPAAAPDAPPAA